MGRSLLIITPFIIVVTSCSNNLSDTKFETEKQKAVDSIIQKYEDLGGHITRKEVEKLVDGFEKIRKEHGDSVIYFDGINVGFAKPFADTANPFQ